MRVLVALPAPRTGTVPRRARVRLFASRTGDTILWEDPAAPVWLDDSGAASVELVFDATDGELFRIPIRYLSVCWSERVGWSERVVVHGMPVRLARRVKSLEQRVAALEEAWRAAGGLQVLAALRDALDDHERRLAVMEAGAPVEALQVRTEALSGRLDRLDRDGGRLVRIEDELEDLVGPRGDVVDFEERLTRLERAILARSSAVTPVPDALVSGGSVPDGGSR